MKDKLSKKVDAPTSEVTVEHQVVGTPTMEVMVYVGGCGSTGNLERSMRRDRNGKDRRDYKMSSSRHVR